MKISDLPESKDQEVVIEIEKSTGLTKYYQLLVWRPWGPDETWSVDAFGFGIDKSRVEERLGTLVASDKEFESKLPDRPKTKYMIISYLLPTEPS